jgi:hypothetical protein
MVNWKGIAISLAQYDLTAASCKIRSVITGFSKGSLLFSGSSTPFRRGGPALWILQCGQ